MAIVAAYQDYYTEGQLLWLDVDTRVRELTGDKRSLDDFVRAFFGAVAPAGAADSTGGAGPGRGGPALGPVTYALADVVQALTSVAPYDWEKYFTEELHAHGPGAPLDGLARGGWKLVYVEVPSEYSKSLEDQRKSLDFIYSLGFNVSMQTSQLTEVRWDGRAMLRPNDLVYNYLVSGWLMGKSPAPFDVLAWNDDATRTTARFACESSRLSMDGWDGSGPTLLGVKTDFSKVTCDSYSRRLHRPLTAWRACYDTAHLVGGAEKEMTLIKSGHIQSVVYPADSTRYDRWYGPPTPTDSDEWLKTAAVEKGSWWRPWTEWLIARSGRRAARPVDPRQPPVPAARPGPRHLRARVART